MSLSMIFSALGDPTRLEILAMLEGEPLAAGAIAARIDTMSRPAVVKHITILRNAGLIETHQQGRQRINALCPTALDAIALWLGRDLGEGVDRELKGSALAAGQIKSTTLAARQNLFSDKPSRLLSARKKDRWG